MDRITKEKRSWIMSKIKSTGTKPELLLAKSLWHRGHRYRKNNRKIFGTPDLTFKKHKLAIFIDSEFFHGKDWEIKKKPVNNAEFWEKKITRNMQRDIEVNFYLTTNGWTVLRFWSKEVLKNTSEVVAIIEKELNLFLL